MLRKLCAQLARLGLLTPTPLHTIGRLLWCWTRFGNSLYTLLVFSCWRYPERTALISEGSPQSYKQLRERTDTLAAAFARYQPVTVAILARNHAVMVESLLACGRLGVNTLLLNTHFAVADVQHVLEHQQVSLLIYDDEFAPLLSAVSLDPARQPKRLSVAQLQHLTPQRLSRLKRGSGRLMLLTSGTTGTAKVIDRKLTLGEALQMAMGLLAALEPYAKDAALLSVPLLHGHGLATLALCLTLALPLYLVEKPTAETLWHYLAEYDISVLVLVPTILHRLLDTPSTPPVQLRRIITGSAPLGGRLARRTAARFGHVLINVYGTSETGVIAVAQPSDLQVSPESVGKVVAGVRLDILDHQQQPLPQGEIGELWITRKSHCIATGDIGYLDSEGRLFLVGRSDDMINCGGNKIYPQALEALIAAHLPYLLECAITAIPDSDYGQATQLFIVVKTPCDTETIKADLAQFLPRSIRPKAIHIVGELPKNALGKLERYKLTQS